MQLEKVKEIKKIIVKLETKISYYYCLDIEHATLWYNLVIFFKSSH